MPDARRLTELLDQRSGGLALVIGNGINIHNTDKMNSWDQLLLRIAHDCAVDVPDVPKGTALTEFYDVLELKRRPKGATDDDQSATLSLQAEFCRLMNDWKPKPHHEAIMGWAMRHEVPVLTTNFEEVLSDAAKCRFHRPSGSPFTDYYPWECRFAHACIPPGTSIPMTRRTIARTESSSSSKVSASPVCRLIIPPSTRMPPGDVENEYR